MYMAVFTSGTRRGILLESNILIIRLWYYMMYTNIYKHSTIVAARVVIKLVLGVVVIIVQLLIDNTFVLICPLAKHWKQYSWLCFYLLSFGI